jgi:hypothetical protein
MSLHPTEENFSWWLSERSFFWKESSNLEHKNTVKARFCLLAWQRARRAGTHAQAPNSESIIFIKKHNLMPNMANPHYLEYFSSRQMKQIPPYPHVQTLASEKETAQMILKTIA